ncbi:MAG TPA: TauD/TfdA family dioxygenase [Streptosporangiaceae bacterium]|nr:TauD/TfdA family dioxygenase [Streptosporangiaceae bacterium]
MTTLMATASTTATLALTRAEALAVDQIADALLPVAGGRIDDGSWQDMAALRCHDLPLGLRRRLAAYRRDPGITGVLLIRSLPVDESLLPDTPAISGSAQRTATVPAAALMLVTQALGFPIAFRAEKNGAMVHDVVPVPGSEEFQGNEGSAPLTFHNENAFHDHRPDHVLLICLRADHDQTAGLRTASIRQAYLTLAGEYRTILRRPEFVTSPPPSFGAAASEVRCHAVLSGAADDPDVLVDFSATRALTSEAALAMDELRSRFAEQAQTHYLRPGDLAIVDNRVTVHGRTAFTPRYDGRDRWLQRTFAVQDLRRSRADRTADGHVLEC